jgi:hypothetical protein
MLCRKVYVFELFCLSLSFFHFGILSFFKRNNKFLPSKQFEIFERALGYLIGLLCNTQAQAAQKNKSKSETFTVETLHNYSYEKSLGA